MVKKTITLYPVFRIIIVMILLVGFTYGFWNSRICQKQVFIKPENQNGYMSLEEKPCEYGDAMVHIVMYVPVLVIIIMFGLLWIGDGIKHIKVEVK